MPTWPADLPVYPLLGTKGTFPALTIASSVDAGPPKVRRRFTAAATRREVSWVLSTAQLASLRRFFMDDLSGGALSFSAVHPVTDDIVTLRVLSGSPPQDEQIGPDAYAVTATLEEMP